MANWLYLALRFSASSALGRSSDGYVLRLHEGWTKETIPFPLSVSPGVEVSGVDQLRLPANMFNKNEQDYWSYLFIW